ncbi:MAG: hypothetical protein JSV05_01225 [Candidatus Bathyarchaeota archaeon]|nr:MAG: hypothetical protein JSV05_01225 [Candidatus Bathyarchaeota archaeon]
MKKRRIFPIERKLAALEWKLELLKASVITTRTPVRTMKSMVHADIVLPTRNLVHELIDSSFLHRDK